MAFELISLEVALIVLIAILLGVILEFGIWWLILRDKFIFPLKQKFLGKGGKIHLVFWHRDGTQTNDLASTYKINEEGIYWPRDKQKKYKVHYVPTNQRDSLGLPIANVVEGLNYTPDLRERNEKVPEYKVNEEGERVNDENGNPIIIEEWKQIVGAGFTTKKASELSYSNYVSAVAFGRATALKEIESKQEEVKRTYIFTAITLVLCVLIFVFIFVHDGKLDSFIAFVSSYKGVVDSALAISGSSITIA